MPKNLLVIIILSVSILGCKKIDKTILNAEKIEIVLMQDSIKKIDLTPSEISQAKAILTRKTKRYKGIYKRNPGDVKLKFIFENGDSNALFLHSKSIYGKSSTNLSLDFYPDGGLRSFVFEKDKEDFRAFLKNIL